jgi:hypothetical protein
MWKQKLKNEHPCATSLVHDREAFFKEITRNNHPTRYQLQLKDIKFALKIYKASCKHPFKDVGTSDSFKWIGMSSEQFPRKAWIDNVDNEDDEDHSVNGALYVRTLKGRPRYRMIKLNLAFEDEDNPGEVVFLEDSDDLFAIFIEKVEEGIKLKLKFWDNQNGVDIVPTDSGHGSYEFMKKFTKEFHLYGYTYEKDV